MRDMLSFLIARDTMHQNQWLAAIEDMGGPAALPVPNSFDQSREKQEFSYVFFGTNREGIPPENGRWTSGHSVDRKSTFRVRQAEPLGEEPVLGPARPDSGAQAEQMG
jgi:Mn-containing catalase